MLRLIQKGAVLLIFCASAAQAQFLTAEAVRPILQATKGNWVAVREFNGQDLLYVTHLMAWRCGLNKIEVAVNSAEGFSDWSFAPCDETAAQPAAIPDDQKLYETFELGSVKTIAVRLTYDDGQTETATFERQSVMTP